MKNKIKDALVAICIVAIVSATAVAITWATLVGNQMEDSKVNTFASPGASVQIAEDKFDGKNWDGTKATVTDGKLTLPISGGEELNANLGEEKAKAYTMGMAIPKNPMLKNDLTALTAAQNTAGITNKEWVAMTATYRLKVDAVYTLTESGGSYSASTGTGPTLTSGYYVFASRSAFETAIATLSGGSISGGSYALYSTVSAEEATGKWVSADTGKDTTFYYTKTLDTGDSTSALFETVTINSSITSRSATLSGQSETFYQINLGGTSYWLKGLPQFQIELKGYAVQADGVAWKSGTTYPAKTALDNLITASAS